ncbi:MAG: ATP-binding protein [Acidobacteria bacterium]|nr:ATP-binding protein [Acidobacteriota bacterium]
MFIERAHSIREVHHHLELFPVTAIVGPRQSGKSTLALQMQPDHYFDLENPRDLFRLEQPQLALEKLKGLICIDEIQRKPDLFPLMRYLTDINPEQRYLILGSASRELVTGSSESLAGRIGYIELGGFTIDEIRDRETLWFRGGLPPSTLSATDADSILWRNNYIKTFLERDLPQLGVQIPSSTIRRFWTMLSHFHGQLLNLSQLGESFGITGKTARHYVDILESALTVRLLEPWHNNTSKRLVKSPKLYIRDSGIFHSLQAIESRDRLEAHPMLGASFEGFALEQCCRVINRDVYFWRTHAGAELDLYWIGPAGPVGAEFKYADIPRTTKSMHTAIADLSLEHLYVIYPAGECFPLHEKITALPLSDVPERLR